MLMRAVAAFRSALPHVKRLASRSVLSQPGELTSYSILSMPTWDEVVREILSGQTSAALVDRQWRPWVSRVPIVITGSSGAGKTELWRRLTGEDAPDELSELADEGYSFPQRRTSLAIETIPGQGLQERVRLLDQIFSCQTRLSGVIFISCYGFDYIWPSLSNAVGRDLGAKNLSALRVRNKRRELVSYQETCDRILQKFSCPTSPDLRPRWLMVIANKADLYWGERNQARTYYTFGSKSPFDNITQQLFADLGSIQQFSYRAIPAAMRPRGYKFRSDPFSYEGKSKLAPAQCESSFHAVIETLGELCAI